MIGEHFPPIAPLHFFRVSVNLPERKLKLLPTTADYLGEESFASVKMGWTKDGLTFEIDVGQKFEGAAYPKYDEGDSVELFIDTRDLKEAGFPTKFCHHFLILPQEVQGVRALELSRFRAEDSHPLCDPEAIEVKIDFGTRGFTYHIDLPAEILHGYDPTTFDKLGFSYRINRLKGRPQHFAVSTTYVPIEQHPSLWATCNLE